MAEKIDNPLGGEDDLDLDLDLDLDIDIGGIDEPAWDRLINQILAGNVIPVIGSDILVDHGNLHRRLVKALVKKFGAASNITSFAELVNDHNFLRIAGNDYECIYQYVNQIFGKEQKGYSPSKLLRDILSIPQFPFVITTSFTPMVEQCMRNIWGKELNVMTFRNNPAENDDIRSEADMRKPTVYYMFGSTGGGAHRYALTDNDMLSFCSSWLNDGKRRPKMLVQALKGKYLLMMGNSYSDWLFRFIWFSIRTAENPCDGLYSSMDEHSSDSDSLTGFLERNHTFIRDNPREVVDQIKRRLAERLASNEKTKFKSVEQDTDVFISYSRSDSDVAEALYKALTERGKRVWYDRDDITQGGKWLDEIKRGIRTARYFVPILSSSIQAEKNDPHVYRQEWKWAIDKANTLGRTFIIPVSEEGFDFYKASIPDRLQQHNATIYKSEEDMAGIAEQIIHTMNQE